VKWLAVIALIIPLSSCTTLVTRRDLYSPEPAPDSQEVRRIVTTTTTIHAEPEATPPQQFRY